MPESSGRAASGISHAAEKPCDSIPSAVLLLVAKLENGALLGATRYAMTDWATQPEAHDVDQVIDELVRLFVSGLSYVPPAGTGTP